MADLIRKVTLERGYDPRDFAMMAYGGCGPAHAASYGADAGAAEIIIPFFATVHSAVGAALSDTRFSVRHSEPIVLPVDPGRLEAIYATMERAGERELAAADVPPGGTCRTAAGSRRASGRQVHHVRIDAPARFDEQSLAALVPAFEREYERLFGPGSALKDAGIELVDYGVDAIGATAKPPFEARGPGDGRRRASSAARSAPQRPDGATPVYDGQSVGPGAEIPGPA